MRVCVYVCVHVACVCVRMCVGVYYVRACVLCVCMCYLSILLASEVKS